MRNATHRGAGRTVLWIGLLVITLLAGRSVRAQETPVDHLQKALAGSDAKALLERAGDRVEVALPSGGSVYSRSQAVYVMEHFFGAYPPEHVSLKNASTDEGSQFVEGVYETTDGRTLQLYLRLHKQDGMWKLHEVRAREGSADR